MPNVLVIENSEPHMRLMAWALQQDGFAVRACTSDESVACAADTAPDIIVFNTSEPAEAKRACIEQVRAAAPGTRIIDLSAEQRPPGAQATGADAYLELPVTAGALKSTIERLLRS
jgi:DNA-binding response OmpR family regulator